MNKKLGLYLIFGVIMVICALVLAVFFDPTGIVVPVISTTATAVGALAIYFQYKRDREINQASFIMDFYDSFYINEDNVRMLDYFDEKYNNPSNQKALTEESQKELLSYLGWIRSLCSLLQRNIMAYHAIDVVYGYKFFICLNDTEVQKLEIEPNAEFYGSFFEVYNNWTKYLKRVGKKEISASTALSKTDCYQKYMSSKVLLPTKRKKV